MGSEKDASAKAKGSVSLDSKRSLLKRPEILMQELHIDPNEHGSLIHQLIEVTKRTYKRKEAYLGHSISHDHELGYKIRQKLHDTVQHVKVMNREKAMPPTKLSSTVPK